MIEIQKTGEVDYLDVLKIRDELRAIVYDLSEQMSPEHIRMVQDVIKQVDNTAANILALMQYAND